MICVATKQYSLRKFDCKCVGLTSVIHGFDSQILRTLECSVGLND